MDGKIKEDILRILRETKEALIKEDIKALKDTSNTLIHSASIFQDEDTITIPIMVYALSKIFERSNYQKYEDWNIFRDTVMKNLRDASQNLTDDNLESYRKNIANIMNSMKKLSSKLKSYIADVMHKSEISKGSRLHEHGISLGRTAEILGISEWELMDYVGKTGISDVRESIAMPVSKRINYARGFFK